MYCVGNSDCDNPFWSGPESLWKSNKHGIGEYVKLIKAIMIQERGGHGYGA